MASDQRAERRRLIAALELAIARSVPPTTMSGYWRTWKVWDRIAKALGATVDRRQLLMRVYQTAAYRVSMEGDR